MGWGTALLKRIMLRKPRLRWGTYKYTISRWTGAYWRGWPAEEFESNQQAQDLARHLLERWVIDHPRNVPGGQIRNGEKNGDWDGEQPAEFQDASVRIDVYGWMANAYLGRPKP